MRITRTPNNRGVALVVAISIALMVSLLAGFVLNLAFRRFNLSHFQESRMIAYYAAEGGIQYVNTRLIYDTTFLNNVLADTTPVGAPVYIISSMTQAGAVARGHIGSTEVLDEGSIGALRMGSLGTSKEKQVTIRIRSLGNGQFEVKAMTDYGAVL